MNHGLRLTLGLALVVGGGALHISQVPVVRRRPGSAVGSVADDDRTDDDAGDEVKGFR